MSISQIMAVIGGVLYIGAMFIPGRTRHISLTIWGGGTFGVVIGAIVGLFLGDIVGGLMWGLGIGTLVGLGAAILEGVSFFIRYFRNA